MWIGEGDEFTEVLVVEISIERGYGPQETDVIEKKKAFLG